MVRAMTRISAPHGKGDMQHRDLPRPRGPVHCRVCTILIGQGFEIVASTPAEFDAFFEALDKDEDIPLTSLKDAVKTHEVIFAADLSASRGGKPVRIADLRKK